MAKRRDFPKQNNGVKVSRTARSGKNAYTAYWTSGGEQFQASGATKRSAYSRARRSAGQQGG